MDHNCFTNSIMSVVFSLGLLLLLPAVSGAEARIVPNLIILNANILTMDERNPQAEAIAIKDEKIVAVGKTSEVKGMAGETTKVIDAKGRTITPGFNDAHLHIRAVYSFESRHYVVPLRPENVANMDELIAALQKKAAVTPKGQWVLGTRYEDTKLGRHPNRWDLDKVSTEHPVHITHSSGHVFAVNSKALELAKITKETPDPPGGSFEKDKTGELTGVCNEGAGKMVLQQGPPIAPPTKEEEMEALGNLFQEFLKKGITSVGDADTGISKIERFQDMLEAGKLPLRINLMILDKPGQDNAIPSVMQTKIRTNFGNDHLKVGTLKLIFGNSHSGRTSWLYEPYDMVNPKTGKKDYYGIPPAFDQEKLDKWVLDKHAAGYQLCIHSNGDRETDMVLDAYEKAQKAYPRPDPRHRIEHVSVSNQKILQRAKDLGVILVFHSYIYEHGDKMIPYGEKRFPWLHANRKAMEMGVPMAQHSDYPVAAADPMLRIQSLATRRTKEGMVIAPEQKITVEQATKLWTINGAYASFEENIKGSITVGKLADLVVLSQDPTKVPDDKIKDVPVDMTIIGGKIVYERK